VPEKISIKAAQSPRKFCGHRIPAFLWRSLGIKFVIKAQPNLPGAAREDEADVCSLIFLRFRSSDKSRSSLPGSGRVMLETSDDFFHLAVPHLVNVVGHSP
jgi:hypothetical protein